MTSLRWFPYIHHQYAYGKFEYEFVKQTGVKVIIGKGGMKENTERACKEFSAIHCVFPAGNAVVAATEVEEIVRAEWRDLGMPETLWNCRVKEFRYSLYPLILKEIICLRKTK